MDKGNDVPRPGGSANQACAESVTSRIEIYAPRDEMAHGSLDGVMYFCDAHAAQFLEVIGWDQTSTITTCRTAVTDESKKCGSGWDFVKSGRKEIKPTEMPHEGAQLDEGIQQAGAESGAEIRHQPTDFGDDHPTITTAVDALTFGGWVDIDAIPRQRAALLLESWAHRPALTGREVEAILAQFPEDAPAPGTEVVEAYELGQAIGRQHAEDQAARDWELLERIDRRLKAAKARHGFTVRATGAGAWVWTCICGTATVVEFHDDEGDVREQLVAHLTAPEVTR